MSAVNYDRSYFHSHEVSVSLLSGNCNLGPGTS